MIDLKSFKIKEVHLDDYVGMEGFWEIGSQEYPGYVIHSKITNPYTTDINYQEFLDELLKNEFIREIAVRDNKDQNSWLRYYVEDLKGNNLKNLIKDIQEIPIKKDYLKAIINLSYVKEQAVISFTEYGGKIISYRARIPFAQRRLFDIESKTIERFQVCEALWAPD